MVPLIKRVKEVSRFTIELALGQNNIVAVTPAIVISQITYALAICKFCMLYIIDFDSSDCML